jgi:hypothetical protein
MKNRRFLFALVISCFIIALLIAYKTYHKPHRDISKAKADHEISADDLYDAYALDEAASDVKFLGKVISVTGEIETVTVDQEGSTVIMLNAASAMMGGVSATMAAGSTSGDADFSAGDRIAVKCMCTGMLMDVILVDCTVEETI